MTSNQKWAEYLKDKSFNKLMIELKKKYISYGKLTGKISIKNISDQERKDISGLLGRHITSDFINAKEIEEAIINNGVYKDANIKGIIDAYFNEDVLTSKQKQEKKNNENDNFYNSLKDIIIKNGPNI